MRTHDTRSTVASIVHTLLVLGLALALLIIGLSLRSEERARPPDPSLPPGLPIPPCCGRCHRYAHHSPFHPSSRPPKVYWRRWRRLRLFLIADAARKQANHRLCFAPPSPPSLAPWENFLVAGGAVGNLPVVGGSTCVVV